MKIVAGTGPQDQEKGLDPHEGSAKIGVVPAQAALVDPPEVARVDQAPVEAPVAAVTPPDPDQETRRVNIAYLIFIVNELFSRTATIPVILTTLTLNGCYRFSR